MNTLQLVVLLNYAATLLLAYAHHREDKIPTLTSLVSHLAGPYFGWMCNVCVVIMNCGSCIVQILVLGKHLEQGKCSNADILNFQLVSSQITTDVLSRLF